MSTLLEFCTNDKLTPQALMFVQAMTAYSRLYRYIIVMICIPLFLQ